MPGAFLEFDIARTFCLCLRFIRFKHRNNLDKIRETPAFRFNLKTSVIIVTVTNRVAWVKIKADFWFETESKFMELKKRTGG